MKKKLLNRKFLFCLTLILGTFCFFSYAEANPPPPTSNSIESALQSLQQGNFLNFNQQLRIFGFVSFLALIPFVIIMTTSFTRLSIIFNFLRQALGATQAPSSQIVVGLSLILTAFIMHPVIEEIHHKAFTPYMQDQFKGDSQVQAGMNPELLLLERTWSPLRNFLLQHTRESDLELFLEIAEVKVPIITTDPANPSYDLAAVPWYCLIPSFVLSELRIAFMMGFLIFMPFLVIDMVVSSILMSLGMMMLPPTMISLPFKLLLFVLVDGWKLIIQQMVNGYYPT